jgi:hypothetical protein
MTLIERIKSWFSAQRPRRWPRIISDEEIAAQYRRALPGIESESQRLGRRSHFFGTGPRVRHTIAEQAN